MSSSSSSTLNLILFGPDQKNLQLKTLGSDQTSYEGKEEEGAVAELSEAPLDGDKSMKQCTEVPAF